MVLYDNINSLRLSKNRIDRLVDVVECLDISDTSYVLFLFGSYAKRCLNSDSDIDLLFIFPDDYEIPKKLDIELMLRLDDVLGEKYIDISCCDILMYNESKFFDICSSMPKSFEGKICSYMVKVKEVIL